MFLYQGSNITETVVMFEHNICCADDNNRNGSLFTNFFFGFLQVVLSILISNLTKSV